MADIKEIKKAEMSEIYDFYYKIKEYGHIFHLDSKLLDEPFKKIIEGMEAVEKMMDDSYGM
jgi:hypothetical protein